jgi:hypothetical protein
MKKTLLISCLAFSVAALYFYFTNYEPSSIAELDTSEINAQNDSISTSDKKIEVEKHNSIKKSNENNNSGDSGIELQTKIPYEDNWCIRSIDLNENDLAYAQQELNDWKEKTGEIWQNHNVNDGKYYDDNNAELLQSFKELDKESLLALAKQDNRYAMIAALQRNDIDWTEQTNIANRLLVFGTTSMSLIHLINREMAFAKVKLEDNDKVTDEVRMRLIKVLTYVFYGNSQYDSSPLTHYVSLTDHDEFSEKALVPNHLLSPEDFEQVERNVEYMTKNIQEQQVKENLTPLSEFDVPKAALHEFDSRLAFLYLNYEQSMENTRRLPLDLGPSIEKSECVKKFIGLYGKHGTTSAILPM